MSKINVVIPTVDEYTVVITMPRGAIVNIKYEVVPEKTIIKEEKSVPKKTNSQYLNEEGVFVDLEEEQKVVKTIKQTGKKNVKASKKVIVPESSSNIKPTDITYSVLPATLPISYIYGKPGGRPTETKRHYFSAGSDLFRMHNSKVDLIRSKGVITNASNWYNEKIGNWYLVYVTEFETGSSVIVIKYDSNGNILKDIENDDLQHIRTYYLEVPVISIETSLDYLGPGCVHVGNYYCKF